MAKRRRIDVYGKRGDAPVYKYTQFDRVKVAKVERLAFETALDVLSHETRGDCTGYIEKKGLTGYIVRVYSPTMLIRFVVRVSICR